MPSSRGSLPLRALAQPPPTTRRPSRRVGWESLPLSAPAVFTFLLGWMLHIAVDRIAGYNLRGKDGFIRA